METRTDKKGRKGGALADESQDGAEVTENLGQLAEYMQRARTFRINAIVSEHAYRHHGKLPPPLQIISIKPHAPRPPKKKPTEPHPRFRGGVPWFLQRRRVIRPSRPIKFTGAAEMLFDCIAQRASAETGVKAALDEV